MRASKQLAGLLLDELGIAAEERQGLIHFPRGGELTGSISTSEPRDNLPHPISSFVGREREIADVKRLIGASRLVTLTGAGGSGKSRLAIEAAGQILDSFTDGIWFVGFAPLSDPTLVCPTITWAFKVREEPGRPLIETLCTYLRSKHLLLVFDNCEHLIEECAQVANTLLQACLQLHILATSREALGIVGEEQFHVPSLSLPGATETSSPGRLMKSEAVRLFVNRASLVRPMLFLTPENSGPISQICRRLDGMPLAIELAAARVKVSSVQHIAEHLVDRFTLLTNGSRTALPRQQTLRATIAWSYDLLPEDTRVLFRRLAVFTGGFTQDAARAVCSDEGLAAHEAIAELSRLVDRSLVEVVQTGETERYRMLETIRQYARERLDECGEAAQLRDRHLEYFIAWMEELEPRLRGPEQIVWWDRIETERDNIRTALEWSLSGGGAQSGLRLASAMYWFWYVRGNTAEELQWIEALLTATGSDMRTPWRAKALLVLYLFLWDRGDYASVKIAIQEALDIWRELGNNWWISCALVDFGWLALYERDVDTALALFQEAVNLANGVDDKWILANALRGLGAAIGRSDYSDARPVLEASIEIWRGIGDKVGLADALHQLGSIAHGSKDYESAARLSEESLALFRQAGFIGNVALMLINLGFTLQRQGEYAKATRLLRESLSWLSERRYRPDLARNLVALGGVAAGQNEPERATRLFGAAASIFKGIGLDMSVWPHHLVDYNEWAGAVRAELGEETYTAAFAEGQAMTLEQAVQYALDNAEEE